MVNHTLVNIHPDYGMNTSHISTYLPAHTIVFIGMMGAGKTSVGRRLAHRLGLPFVDSDDEIVTASGMSIPQFFEQYGEAEFRKGERKVIARLLEQPVQVLSTGGGAYMDPETRALIQSKAIAIWLHADPAILVERATRHNDRPLLQGGNPHDLMIKLLETRSPVYALADITINSDNHPIDETVDRVIKALIDYTTSQERQ